MRERGYSLIEVMLVVAILGIVAALAVPKVTDMVDRRNAQNTLVQFTKTLEAARDTARESRRCIRVSQASASSLTLDTRAITSAGACTATSESTATKTFNANYIVIPNTLDITFDKQGAVDGVTTDSSTITVTSTAAGASVSRSYLVYTLLGLVRAL